MLILNLGSFKDRQELERKGNRDGDGEGETPALELPSCLVPETSAKSLQKIWPLMGFLLGPINRCPYV